VFYGHTFFYATLQSSLSFLITTFSHVCIQGYLREGATQSEMYLDSRAHQGDTLIDLNKVILCIVTCSNTIKRAAITNLKKFLVAKAVEI
jgi:hypothetical protein